MRSIRKGNTFVVEWTIVDQMGEPINLDWYRDVQVYLSATMWQMKVDPFTIVDHNKVQFTFQGVDQVFVGIYSLTLYINKDKQSQQVVDTKDAFRLVASSDDREYDENEQIQIEVVELTGTTDANGYSPTATVERELGGVRITMKDKDGTTTADLYDGEKGETGASGVGFESVSSQEDGTVVITLSDGNTITIDLNHNHPNKPNYVYCSSQAAYDAITTKEDDTMYLILDN